MNSNASIGYCGNVHPATTVDQLIANLQQHTGAVAKILGGDHPMPFGIWLSASVLEELQTPAKLDYLRETIAAAGVTPFTVNGFPFGDFHQDVVKQAVYRPDWTDQKRLRYTLQLADLHHQLLPPGEVSTISTLPLGWPTDGPPAEAFFKECAENLAACASELNRRFEETGRRHIICIEPEPGCVIDTCDDVVDFFQQHLDQHDQSLIRKHIGVCHDICHSAVMFEPQDEAIAAYSLAGIEIGKVQVSSAIEIDFDQLNEAEKNTARQQLSSFCEAKYLHQTCVNFADSRREFYVDLPDALANNPGTGVWRTHFHVPVFLEGFGQISATQRQIHECIEALKHHQTPVHHFEVETYAWPMLPKGIFDGSLVQGIAEEVRWFRNLMKQN